MKRIDVIAVSEWSTECETHGLLFKLYNSGRVANSNARYVNVLPGYKYYGPGVILFVGLFSPVFSKSTILGSIVMEIYFIIVQIIKIWWDVGLNNLFYFPLTKLLLTLLFYRYILICYTYLYLTLFNNFIGLIR